MSDVVEALDLQDCECGDCDESREHFEHRAVDNSGWDGGAAMSNCASSSTPASCYGSICAGRKAGDPALQSSWALPHHKSPGSPPNAAGCRNAMSRLSQTEGLTNASAARSHLEAHMRQINPGAASRPPRDNLVRALDHAYELRHAGDGMPTLTGHFAVFNEWTEIESIFEGHFMERISPGAFRKTFKENRDRIRVLFQHGRDPQIGDKVLGPVQELQEDEKGAFYEVPLLDTSYNRDLLPGLEAEQYGSSFRFRVTRDEFNKEPKASEENPTALPERTIREVEVMEFGPVTFPAYAGATAGVRSLTDEFMFDRLVQDPTRLRELVEFNEREEAPSDLDAGAEPHLEEERREEPADPEPEPTTEVTVEDEKLQYRTKEEKKSRIAVLKSELAQLADEFDGVLMPDAQERWDASDKEVRELQAAYDAQVAREQRVEQLFEKGDTDRVTDPPQTFTTIRKPDKGAIYDRASVYRDARSPEDAAQRFRENALHAVEETTFPHERANQEDVKGHIEKLLHRSDSRDGEIAKRILVTGSPAYRRAFGKVLQSGDMNAPMSAEERTVMAEGAGATGGFAITFDLDPTIVPTSNGAVNPFRRVCRVVTIAGTNEWRGVSSGAVTADYVAEAAESTDNSPTLAQPAFIAKRAHVLVPFSIELQQDWGGLQAELARLIQDSKDTLEADRFAVGTGTTPQPQGITVGATTTTNTGTTTVLAVADLYKAEEALAPRFRPNAQWFANRFIFNKVRQLDTAGGASLWVENLRQGLAANETGNTGYNLLGYPANEASGMAASLATTTKLAVLGDPSYYVIVDRVGLDIELIPHLFGTTANYPTGQRAVYAIWRNTARVFENEGFITLVGL